MLTSRLARIVDRGRAIEARHGETELALLEQRAHLIYRALTLGVSSAILVSLLMALAFVGALSHLDVALGVAIVFICALFAYTGALMCLLREVFLAIGGFRLVLPSPPKT